MAVFQPSGAKTSDKEGCGEAARGEAQGETQGKMYMKSWVSNGVYDCLMRGMR